MPNRGVPGVDVPGEAASMIFFSLLIVALLAAIVEQVVYRERLAYALESKGFEILAQVGG